MCKDCIISVEAIRKPYTQFGRGGKKDVICKLLKHHSVEDLLPNYVTSGRLFEGDKGMLENMRVVYGNLASTRQNLNLRFNNVLLSAVVSSNVTSNQMHIARSLGASRHFVKNVMVGWIHVDQIRENFWGGCPGNIIVTCVE
jgi:hypothetical protein